MPEYDGPDHYLALVPLDKFGLNEVPDTGDLATNKLRDMVNILQIMRSEYLRRLCLCFCPELKSSQVGDDLMDIIDDLSDSFSDHFNNVCNKLELMLHFCKAQGMTSEDNSKVEVVKNLNSSTNICKSFLIMLEIYDHSD